MLTYIVALLFGIKATGEAEIDAETLEVLQGPASDIGLPPSDKPGLLLFLAVRGLRGIDSQASDPLRQIFCCVIFDPARHGCCKLSKLVHCVNTW